MRSLCTQVHPVLSRRPLEAERKEFKPDITSVRIWVLSLQPLIKAAGSGSCDQMWMLLHP